MGVIDHTGSEGIALNCGCLEVRWKVLIPKLFGKEEECNEAHQRAIFSIPSAV